MNWKKEKIRSNGREVCCLDGYLYLTIQRTINSTEWEYHIGPDQTFIHVNWRKGFSSREEVITYCCLNAVEILSRMIIELTSYAR